MDGLGELPLFPKGTSWEAAWGRLEEFALNDGLPMVPPTGDLLEVMLGSASGGRSHGQLPPLFGELTATAVAYQCVLAGCEPGVLPLVLAAATACLEAKFNLLGLLTTTGTPAVMAIVHGGCAEQLGMNGGSNCLGEFPVDNLMTMLEKQHSMWDEVGIDVRSCAMGDPMSHCTPAKVEESVYRVKERWPEINHIRLHLHNGRNMAIASAYAAMRVLGPDDTLDIDGTIGGFGGCPYCGNGRATGMAPTEDLIHMMEDMGIETGVDIDKLIDCVWALESVVGRELYGHVSKAGPRPKKHEQLYNIDMPFVETLEQAKHFKVGPSAYEGGIYPYQNPITSPYRDRVDAGQQAYDDGNGDWPWKQDWFPAKD